MNTTFYPISLGQSLLLKKYSDKNKKKELPYNVIPDHSNRQTEYPALQNSCVYNLHLLPCNTNGFQKLAAAINKM